MIEAISIRVAAPPPAKDGAKSIFSLDHPHYPRVVALRAAIQETMVNRTPFEGVPLRLAIAYERATCRADALNIVNGIADVLQRRPTMRAYANETWAFDDDVNIREIAYRETSAAAEAYQIVITRIDTSS